MDKKERLNQVYRYLLGVGLVTSQKDLASRMGASEANVSVALKTGAERVLTKKFLMRLCEAFPGLLSLEWLLNGTGDMLKNAQEQQKVTPETYQDLNVVLIKEIEQLRLQAKDELATIRSVRSEIEQTRDILRKAVWALARVTPLSDYDVAMGDKVAEDNNIT